MEGLLGFLDASRSPFHAVRNLARHLEDAGYRRIDEREPWAVTPGERVYLTRNDSSIVALRTGRDPTDGLRMIGAHTDSPCLRLKPEPVFVDRGYLRLGVEVYGGVLLNPWFDRDLSLAGRVHYLDERGTLQTTLLDFARPIAVIPSLAIHLDREANSNRSVNAQTDIVPVLGCLADDTRPDIRALLAEELGRQLPDAKVASVLDYELGFYDTQGAARVGLEQEFLASARLDNLVSCWCGVQALLHSDEAVPALLVCNDHEEVGSQSSSGAGGPFLRSVLERMSGSADGFVRLITRSMLISADNAHGVHPNYADRHEPNHGPVLGKGPVIKVNANQRYASNSATQALFRNLCAGADVPVQTFVTRTDLGCGSTIGPITATELGVPTLDVGIPQFAMHSIRELCSARDPAALTRALIAFQSLPTLPPLI
ncbi:MAG: M18 family aminopeptidase [Pseudomonadales bacterium]|nr:M18 family aminopeptidase [Pseudomonadales bacterium]